MQLARYGDIIAEECIVDDLLTAEDYCYITYNAFIPSTTPRYLSSIFGHFSQGITV